MKLTCALIVAMLLLTACQLITTDDFRGRQQYRTARSRTKMQNYKIFRLTKRCDAPNAPCEKFDNDCCDACMLREKQQPICAV
uniref:Conotoxin MiK42 n=1 Tax=Conus miles TaxID=69564 RepID=O1642_CONMI|nr:RecName: Full=Conotoxin MiK42; Flags: Precursor [Conus miles]AAZ83751.1 MiK42P [Conus miles]